MGDGLALPAVSFALPFSMFSLPESFFLQDEPTPNTTTASANTIPHFRNRLADALLGDVFLSTVGSFLMPVFVGCRKQQNKKAERGMAPTCVAVL
jgi:hypothetical protein